MTSYVGATPAFPGHPVAEPWEAAGLPALVAAVLSVGVEPAGGRLPAQRRRAGRVVLQVEPEPRTPADAQGSGRDGPRPEQPQPEPERDERTWALVEAAQAGDVNAFGELYDRYVDAVHRYAYSRLGDRTLAEDVTSETFLRALRRIGTVSYRGRDVGAWFLTIARNLVLDHVKSGRHRYEVVTADLRDGEWATESPEREVLDRLASAELLRCIRRLAPDQQECVVLRFLQGLSVAETATVMERNEGAVKALQHRAVRRLATLLPEGVR